MRRKKNDNKEDDLMPEKGSDLDLEREFEGSKSDRAMDRSRERERLQRGKCEREREVGRRRGDGISKKRRRGGLHASRVGEM